MANRGKKSEAENAAYEALQALMAKPGDPGAMWGDLLPILTGSPYPDIARAVTGLNYDDRTTALVYGAVVEQSLEGAIATHFPNPTDAARIFSYDDDGALSTFAAKIAM